MFVENALISDENLDKYVWEISEFLRIVSQRDKLIKIHPRRNLRFRNILHTDLKQKNSEHRTNFAL